MRWRLIKWFFILLVILIAVGWLSQHDGIISIDWMGYRVEARMLLVLPLLCSVALLILVCDRLWRWFVAMPTRLAARRRQGRQERAYQSVMEGFTAVAAGDHAAAKKMARQSWQLFQSLKQEVSPLYLLLSAQTALLEGDQKAANDYYHKMLEHKQTEFLGLRGLLVQHMRQLAQEGDDQHHRTEALKLSQRAYALRPETPWLVQVLTELYVRQDQWEEALAVIGRARKRHVLATLEADRLSAIVHWRKAQRLKKQDKLDNALQEARQAHKKRQSFIPAVLLLVDIHESASKPRKALTALEQSWSYHPHPELAARYQQLIHALAADKRLQKIEKLVKHAEDHVESRILMARAAIDARQWAKARNHLKSAFSVRQEARICHLMAELEENADVQGEEEARKAKTKAAEWRQRAQDCQPDARWICSACGEQHIDWEMLCRHCGAFDTIRWASPGTPLASLEGGRHALSELEYLPAHSAI